MQNLNVQCSKLSEVLIENNNLKLRAQLFSDTGSKSYEYELSGGISEAVKIGKLVGEQLLKLAGSEFKKK